MLLGTFLCTANHMWSIFFGDAVTQAGAVKEDGFGKTGLRHGDVKRTDRQNVLAAVRRRGRLVHGAFVPPQFRRLKPHFLLHGAVSVVKGAVRRHMHGPSIPCHTASQSQMTTSLPFFFKLVCKQNLDLRCVLVPAPWLKHVSNPE